METLELLEFQKFKIEHSIRQVQANLEIEGLNPQLILLSKNTIAVLEEALSQINLKIRRIKELYNILDELTR
jgi:hypothetical protein